MWHRYGLTESSHVALQATFRSTSLKTDPQQTCGLRQSSGPSQLNDTSVSLHVEAQEYVTTGGVWVSALTQQVVLQDGFWPHFTCGSVFLESLHPQVIPFIKHATLNRTTERPNRGISLVIIVNPLLKLAQAYSAVVGCNRREYWTDAKRVKQNELL